MSAFINWQDSYSVNLKAIDEQHKQILGILNDIFNETASGEGKRESLKRNLFRLRVFTETHFQYEETVLKLIGYPELQAHAAMHRIMELKTRNYVEFDGSYDSEKAQELLLFLKNWWVKHICGTDKGYSGSVGALDI